MTKQILVSVPQKDLSIYKTQALSILQSANALTITSEADLQAGADVLHRLKEIENEVLGRKEEITRPLMKSLSSTRELFKPFETAFADAKKVIKKKILDFQVAEAERIENEKAKIEARVMKGTMRVDTGVAKLETVGEVKTSTSGAVGSIQTRSVTKVRIQDETLIPREYLMPDMAKITAAVLQDSAVIPGVEKYTEKIIASR